MAKKQSVTIGKHHIQRGGGDWADVKYTAGPMSGKVQTIRLDRALSLKDQGKCEILKKFKT